MSEDAPGRSVPEPSPTSAPFWTATRDRRFLIQRCATCGSAIWYPRAACPVCLGADLEWHEAAGQGVVYATSTHRRPANPAMAGRVPYVVALVDLPEGVRMLSGIVGPGAEEARAGARVTLTWEALDDGRHLPLFEVTSADGG